MTENFNNSKQLRRSTTDKMISGVCGGIADYLNMDATLVRLVTAALVLFTGVGPIVYLLAWILIPVETGGSIGEDLAKKANQWVQEQQAKNNQPQPPAGGMPNQDDLR